MLIKTDAYRATSGEVGSNHDRKASMDCETQMKSAIRRISGIKYIPRSSNYSSLACPLSVHLDTLS